MSPAQRADAVHQVAEGVQGVGRRRARLGEQFLDRVGIVPQLPLGQADGDEPGLRAVVQVSFDAFQLDGLGVGSGVRGACKEVAPGIWGDHLDLGSTLVTVRGNTLVEVTGELAKDDLLAVLRDVRPMNAWELAWLALKDSSYDLGMIVAG